MKAEVKYIKGLIRDIKLNGMGFIKSELVANEVRVLAPEIIVEYSKEDKTYVATFYK